MRLVSGYRAIHELYSPKSRKLHFPKPAIMGQLDQERSLDGAVMGNRPRHNPPRP